MVALSVYFSGLRAGVRLHCSTARMQPGASSTAATPFRQREHTAETLGFFIAKSIKSVELKVSLRMSKRREEQFRTNLNIARNPYLRDSPKHGLHCWFLHVTWWLAGERKRERGKRKARWDELG